PGHTRAVVLGNIKAAVFGKQAFITVKFVGFNFGRPGNAQRYAFGYFTLPAQFHAPAGAGVGALITDCSAILRHHGKTLNTIGFKALMHPDGGAVSNQGTDTSTG